MNVDALTLKRQIQDDYHLTGDKEWTSIETGFGRLRKPHASLVSQRRHCINGVIWELGLKQDESAVIFAMTPTT
jgi:hypothetical protein